MKLLCKNIKSKVTCFYWLLFILTEILCFEQKSKKLFAFMSNFQKVKLSIYLDNEKLRKFYCRNFRKQRKKEKEKKATTPDNALSVYIQLVDSLKAHLKSKEAEMQARLNEKDRTIDALEKRIKEKDELLEHYRRENTDLKAQIANSSYTYPFPHGVAEDKKSKRTRK